MALIKALGESFSSTLADQWKEFYYCDSLENEVLIKRASKKTNSNSQNLKGKSNVISNGSLISVADGQFMIIVDQGKVIELSAEPGEFIFDSSAEHSIFEGNFDRNLIEKVLDTMKERFKFGGDSFRDQRIYYINTKELTGNYYGTSSPIPFRVVDKNTGLDLDTVIRCYGEYSYKITNPLLFYMNVSGNVENEFTRKMIDAQLKSELLTSLQPAFSEISKRGIRYYELPSYTIQLTENINKILTNKWREFRGIEIVSFAISSLKIDEKDEEVIKELQKSATFKDPNMAAAHLVNAQSIAIKEAAMNKNSGPAMAFLGMNMANQIGGINIEHLYNLTNQKAKDIENNLVESKENEKYWTCKCGKVNNSSFCSYCGTKKPESKMLICKHCGWTSNGECDFRFCPDCGESLSNNN